MKLAAASALVAVLAIGGARIAREAAVARAPQVIADEPYAPTPGAAPLVALGYRELFADLLFLRLRGYFGGRDNTANGIAALVEAIVALDPEYQRSRAERTEMFVLVDLALLQLKADEAAGNGPSEY